MDRTATFSGWMLVLAGVIGCVDAPAPPKPVTSTPKPAVGEPEFVDQAASTETVTAAKEPTGDAPEEKGTQETPPPKRIPIYTNEASGQQLIDKAIRQAQRDHKRVLIEWGFNSCIWCVRLHEVFKNDAQVHPLVYEEFVLVLVDSTINGDLMREYGGKDRRYSFPHLTILDENGEVLTNQSTESLEKGDGHDPQVVADFLRKWPTPKLDAEEAVATALQKAATHGKRVFVRVGNPYCGWCNILAQFMQDHSELIAKDYVDIKIDTLRMTNGEAVASRYQPAAQDGLGVPWMVVLDDTGKTLASSVGPKGNIGYPYQLPEIDYFIGMLRDTRQKLTDEELDQLRSDLVKFHDDREGKKN